MIPADDFRGCRPSPLQDTPARRSSITARTRRTAIVSGQQFAARGARSIAEAVGSSVVTFPSHHGGFLGGEYGRHGDPAAFAAALHAVLDA